MNRPTANSDRKLFKVKVNTMAFPVGNPYTVGMILLDVIKFARHVIMI